MLNVTYAVVYLESVLFASAVSDFASSTLVFSELVESVELSTTLEGGA